MTELNKSITISEEQIHIELSTPNNLLIVGSTGSGKTTLINRILRHLEQQPDMVYVFISPDLANHIGSNSYGHINALRLTMNDIETRSLSIFNLLDDISDKQMDGDPMLLQNVAIEFPFVFSTEYNEIAHGKLCSYLEKLRDMCRVQYKKFVVVSDELDAVTNFELYIKKHDCKFIVTVSNINDLVGCFDDYNPLPKFKTIQL